MVKVPQVLAVMRANSAEGLSLLAFELETLGFLIAATYGLAHKLAFTAYGETMVSFFQLNFFKFLFHDCGPPSEIITVLAFCRHCWFKI
jgi:mannose-P-dolichol utilization defect protein 1